MIWYFKGQKRQKKKEHRQKKKKNQKVVLCHVFFECCLVQRHFVRWNVLPYDFLFLKNMNMPSDWTSCRSSNPSWDPCWKKEKERKKKSWPAEDGSWWKTHEVVLVDFPSAAAGALLHRGRVLASVSSKVLHFESDRGLLMEQWSSYVALPEVPPHYPPTPPHPPFALTPRSHSVSPLESRWLAGGAFTPETSFRNNEVVSLCLGLNSRQSKSNLPGNWNKIALMGSTLCSCFCLFTSNFN